MDFASRPPDSVIVNAGCAACARGLGQSAERCVIQEVEDAKYEVVGEILEHGYDMIGAILGEKVGARGTKALCIPVFFIICRSGRGNGG